MYIYACVFIYRYTGAKTHGQIDGDRYRHTRAHKEIGRSADRFFMFWGHARSAWGGKRIPQKNFETDAPILGSKGSGGCAEAAAGFCSAEGRDKAT